MRDVVLENRAYNLLRAMEEICLRGERRKGRWGGVAGRRFGYAG